MSLAHILQHLRSNHPTTPLENEYELRPATKLDLCNKGLSEVPHLLELLTNVVVLSLGVNQLQSLPDRITALKNLQELWLGDNQLTSLPDSIGYMTGLSFLYVFNNKLSALPQSLGNLTELRELHLQNNHLNSLPPFIGYLTMVTSLRLQGNKISRLPESITRLHGLSRLQLESGEKSDIKRVPDGISRLPCWTNLEKPWDDMALSFSAFLRTLRLCKTCEIGMRDISDEHIIDWTVCNSLNLSDNKLSSIPDAMKKLTDLTHIDISGNQFDSLPDVIHQMPRVASINISKNKLEFITPGLSALVNLASITLSKNKITGLPNEINIFLNLTKLDISANLISTLPDNVWRAAKLQELDISRNKISLLPSGMRFLTGLTALNISNNQFSSLPQHISSMTCLIQLRLYNEKIEVIPEWITVLRGLQIIQLSSDGQTNIKRAPLGLTELPCWENCENLSSGIIELYPGVLRHLQLYVNSSCKEITDIHDKITEWQLCGDLDISLNKISVVPASIGDLKKLFCLNISSNQISSLPGEFSLLSSLLNLDMSRNIFTIFPRVLLQISWIRELNISRNKIRLVPDEIFHMSELQSLNMENNKIKVIPPGVGFMSNLSSLQLGNNEIDELPKEIAQLWKLESLGIESRGKSSVKRIPLGITSLPVWNNEHQEPGGLEQKSRYEAIRSALLYERPSEDDVISLDGFFKKIAACNYLDLSKRQLSQISESISLITSIRQLDLSDNQLSSLPASFSRLTSLTHLKLSGNKFVELPSAISSSRGLQLLDISSNQLSIIPNFISVLINLHSVWLHQNKLSSYPDPVSNLTNVSVLSLGSNKITSLPESIGNLVNISYLALYDNPIKELPDSISKMKLLDQLYLEHHGQFTVKMAPLGITQFPCWRNDQKPWSEMTMSFSHVLRKMGLFNNQVDQNIYDVSELIQEWVVCCKLNLTRNKLLSLPESISQLVGLSDLNLARNLLTSIPDAIGELVHLTNLDISNNKITSIPSSISKLGQLERFNFSKNKITKIPDELGNLHRAREGLIFVDNPIEYPPEAEMGEKSETLFTYLTQKLSLQPRTFGTESYVYIFGDPGSGYTEVKDFLLQQEPSSKPKRRIRGQALDPVEEPSTKIVLKEKLGERPVIANIGDFSDHEKASRFGAIFSSHTTIFVLVYRVGADNLLEGIDNWIQKIKSLASQGRIIVVGTPGGGKKAEVAEAERKSFNSYTKISRNYDLKFCGHYFVNIRKGIGSSELKVGIHEQICKATLLEDSVEEHVVRLKDFLQKYKDYPQKYLHLSDIRSYCTNKLQMSDSLMEDALSYLTRFGMIYWSKIRGKELDVVFLDIACLKSLFQAFFLEKDSIAKLKTDKSKGVYLLEDVESELCSLLEKDIELDSLRDGLTNQIIKLFHHLGLSATYKNTLELFPCFMESKEHPNTKWTNPGAEHVVTYLHRFEASVPEVVRSALIVEIMSRINYTEDQLSSRHLFLGQSFVVFSFSLSEKDSNWSVSNGDNFLCRIKFEKEPIHDHNAKEPKQYQVLVEMQMPSRRFKPFKAMDVLMDSIVKPIICANQKPYVAGYVCPNCWTNVGKKPSAKKRSEEDEVTKGQKVASIELKCILCNSVSWNKEYSDGIPKSIPDPGLAGYRTKKPGMSLQTISNSCIGVYFSDRICQRTGFPQTFLQYARPWLEWEASKLGIKISFENLLFAEASYMPNRKKKMVEVLDDLSRCEYFVDILLEGDTKQLHTADPANLHALHLSYPWTKDYDRNSSPELLIAGSCLIDIPLCQRVFLFQDASTKDQKPETKVESSEWKLTSVSIFQEGEKLIDLIRGQIYTALKQDHKDLKFIPQKNTVLSKIRKFSDGFQSHVTFSPGEVHGFIADFIAENSMKSEAQKLKDITLDEISKSALVNPFLCLLAFSEAWSVNMESKWTRRMRIYITPSTSTTSDVINQALDGWSQVFGAASVSSTLVPLLMAEKGIASSLIFEYYPSHEPQPPANLLLQRRAFVAHMEKHGIIVLEQSTERYKLSGTPDFHDFLREKYLNAPSSRIFAWWDYSKVIVQDFKAHEGASLCKQADIFREFMNAYFECLKEAGENTAKFRGHFITQLGEDQMSRVIAKDKEVYIALCRDYERYKFKSRAELWTRLLEESKFAVLHLCEVLLEDQELHTPIYMTLLDWTYKMRQNPDHVFLERAYQYLEKVAKGLGRSDEETKGYQASVIDCRRMQLIA